MGDSGKREENAAASRTSGSHKCNAKIRSSTQGLDEEQQEFLDLTDFMKQRIENELEKVFCNRYTMDNELYAEVANGFPNPVVVYPWNKRPKRNFDYTARRPWSGSRQGSGTEWRGDWGNPGYDPYVSHASRKRRNPDMDRDRVFYPGRMES